MFKSSIIWLLLIVGCQTVPKKKEKDIRCTYGIDNGAPLKKERLDSLVNRKMYLRYTRVVPMGKSVISVSENEKYIHYYTDTLSFLMIKSDSTFFFKDQKGKWFFDSAGIAFLNDPSICSADAINGKFRLDKLSEQKYLLEHHYYFKDSSFSCRFIFSLKPNGQ